MTNAARQLCGPSTLAEPTRRSLAAGEVPAEQAVVVATAMKRLSSTIDPARVETVQAKLIARAGHASFPQLQREANHVVEMVDPDGADQILERQLLAQEKRAWASASLVLQRGIDETTTGRFTVPDLHAATLRKVLDACTSPRREDRIVDGGTSEPLPNATRMGQSLCELIEHLPTDALPQHGVANATLVVTVEEQKLRAAAGDATLDTGESVSISEARRLACNAGIVPMVLAGDSKVLDLGTGRRLFNRYQRLALTIRDAGCVFPGAYAHPPGAKHITSNRGVMAGRPI